MSDPDMGSLGASGSFLLSSLEKRLAWFISLRWVATVGLRINVVEIHLPPLRERRQDIP